MNTAPTDYLGNELHVGDQIVYPGRAGSSLWMVGPVTILDITETPSFYAGCSPQVKLKIRGKGRGDKPYTRCVVNIRNTIKISS